MELTGELLVHSKQIADLTTAHTDVAGRYVHVRTDYLEQFAHKGLTETHDLCIALSTGGKIGTTFATTHGKRGKRILEGLLEPEELQDGKVYRRVETQSALIRTDGTVELYAVADVHLHFSLVVNPRYTEGGDALRFHNALDDLCLLKLRMLVIYILDGFQHFSYCL